ncbi:Copper amine oxidase N-terminal domain-containing protein [Caloranaerobacter azorensis DSM 13643]|uniref:Copper amine oxidase N-terminal domain-containing protein n=1 Tax=Caloranaerobacter azorensis DSM 13643 TaxID=1121264 RepID=A0A1M5V0A1_9FIRM|nr:glycosyl hydrolase family 18 protein [Caloranaerobacter azorensis]SHH68590.1 Copper amine oxidase N-terminal domain-containing protein [Caloranaerobacter azorensis DSM 13643]
MRGKKSISVPFIIFCILILSITVYAETTMQTIQVLFNYVNLQVNGKNVQADNILYNGTTYAPVRAVAEMLGKEVKWDETTKTISINDKANESITINSSTGKQLELHTFYAINSYEQFKTLLKNKSIQNINSISFGWSRMEYDEQNNKVFLNMTTSNENDFYVPYGFNEPLNFAKQYNISTQLNVYADKNIGSILEHKDSAIKQIIDSITGKEVYGENITFDGVVIDFEGLGEKDSQKFIMFLKNLKEELVKKNKKLYVTVPPKTWNNAYDYREIGHIADKVILMAHDYDDKDLESTYLVDEIVYTPLTPISKVRQALLDITDEENGVAQKDKILLQINFGSAQWKVKEGKLYSSEINKDDNVIYPDRPTYEMIYSRIKEELNKGRTIDEIINFDDNSKNPYIRYYNDLEGTDNIIWYEDSRSVIEKINLAKEFKIGGISLWRLGNIPDYYNPGNQEFYLDIWQQIQKNIAE